MSNSEGFLPQNRLHSTTLYDLMEEADKKTCAYEYCVHAAGFATAPSCMGLKLLPTCKEI